MSATPQETPGRVDYYNAALIEITLFCRSCRASLDPDCDLGEGLSFASDGYYILLGDEAFRRGWLIEAKNQGGFRITCPVCALKDE
jgi:hypothetical protein